MPRRTPLALFALFVLAWIATGRFATADAPWAKPLDQAAAVLMLPSEADKVVAPWQVTGKLQRVQDDLLGREVYDVPAKTRLVLRSAAIDVPEYVVEALVRLPDETPLGGNATLRCGVTSRGAKLAPAYSLGVSRQGDRGFYLHPIVGEGTIWTQPLREDVKPEKNTPTRWSTPVAERYPLERISPVWDEDFRVGVENDMTAIPLGKNVWRRLRIEVSRQRVRMYHNGLLAFDEPNRAVVHGDVVLELTGAARVAGLEVRPLSRVNGPYELVSLEDLCNARDFVAAGSLPPADRTVTINQIPFVFSPRGSRSDHVDVGVSQYRERATQDGGEPLESWPTAGQIDPARLMVRVPKGAYRRLWVVAAHDGEANSTPVLTARFYKPRKGWPIDGQAQLPAITATSADTAAVPLSVQRPDGKPGHLWLVPIDLDGAALASDYREEPVFHLELTKEVKDYRAFPDPLNYGTFQAGLPSGARVFAMTLETTPVALIAQGNRTGSTYPYPEQPAWKVNLENQTAVKQEARVRVDVTSPRGKSSQITDVVTLDPGATALREYLPETREYGLYQVRTTLVTGDCTQSRDATFLTLPPDTRTATGKTTRWGLWVWNGAHGTIDNPSDTMQLLRAMGSYVGGGVAADARTPWRIAPCPTLAFHATPPWAFKDPYDPAEYAAYSEECGKKAADYLVKTPDLEYVSIFAEHMISLRVTHGAPPEAFGKAWYDYTPEEKASVRAHLLAAKAAYEGCRKHAPKLKFLFGHCGPLFSLPFMKQDFPKEWFDGYGIDCPQFERMPERQPRAVEPSQMYFLNQEMKERGYDKELVHVESYYPSSHRLALGARGSADSVVRTAVLSMANGTDRFLACWTLEDCEGYWGSQHYGCIGLISRRPEYNPKPAAPAFSTMTQILDTAQYDGWVPTGSHSAYCVRFKDRGKLTYCLWTIRGTRPLTLHVKQATKLPGTLVQTDENGNETQVEVMDGRGTVTLSPTPIWVTAAGLSIEKAEVGTPVYKESPGTQRIVLDDFEKGNWLSSDKPDEKYATNSWDVVRVPAAYTSARVESSERKSKVWQVTMTEAGEKPTITSRYRVFTPTKPLEIPGKAQALEIQAKGNSGWGRIVYEVVDAKGETFQSIGTLDAWNCDDTHSWSYFNFDGWRYMEFPLPSNSPGDDYREKDSVWWNHSAEGVVDLPLKLSKIIVEMPTHLVYIDQMLPVESRTVELDDLVAVYESPSLMTEEPVRVQRAATGMMKPKQKGGDALPNPLAKLRETGVGAATKIVKQYPPESYNDGTRTHVSIAPVEGAKEYQVWVAAYADGRGAMVMKKGPELEPLVPRLRPNMPMYFYVTYTDADGKPSKPSESVKVELKDEFVQQ
jgi:hypothetical protein